VKDIMVDLETLSTRSNAIIVSIGAVYFDETDIGDTFYRRIDISDSIRSGKYALDADTLKWWLKQSDEARQELTSSDSGEVKEVLKEFASFIKDKEHRVWGNGAAFDNVILQNAFMLSGIYPPWVYWNDRCFRTVKSMFSDIPEPGRQGTHHNALDDAKHQVAHLQKIYEEEKLVLED
jgi:hypothetical protein